MASNTFFRTLEQGEVDIAPLPAISIEGEASWDGKALKIKDFNVAQIQRIKELDALLINGELAIVMGLPANLQAEIINIPLMPGRKFSDSFTDEPMKWAKGVKWSGYPVNWHIVGDDFQVNGVSYTTAISFIASVLPVLVEANDDTNIGSGLATLADENFAKPFCQAVKDCIGSATEQQPFVEPPNIIYQTNITHNLNGNGLSYIGAVLNGDTLARDFDEFGNDIGGFQGTNTIGSGSIFNTIKGADNSIGDGSLGNVLVGQNNSIGEATGFNQVSGEDNTIGEQSGSNIVSGFNNHLGESSNINLVSGSNVSVGDNSDRNVFVGNNITVGDNVNGCFAAGQNIVIDSGAVFSAAWGVGHNPTCNYSYMHGSYGICQGAAIVLGNGTDSLNKSNAFYVKGNGELMHTGAYANRATQIHTAGGSVQANDNINTLIYEIATTQLNEVINLPVNPIDGQTFTIIPDGLANGTPVISGWTLDGGAFQIIGNAGNDLVVGSPVHFKFANNKWYIL